MTVPTTLDAAVWLRNFLDRAPGSRSGAAWSFG